MYNAKECAPTSLLDDYLSWLDGLCSTYLSIQQAQCPGAFQGRGIVIPESQVALALSGQTSVAPQSGFLSRLRCLQEKMVQTARKRFSTACPASGDRARDEPQI